MKLPESPRCGPVKKIFIIYDLSLSLSLSLALSLSLSLYTLAYRTYYSDQLHNYARFYLYE